MAGEKVETPATEEPVMTGADDGLNLDDTVAGLAESLHLVEDEDKGTDVAAAPADDKAAVAPPVVEKPAEGAAAKPEGTAPATEERVPDTWRKEAKEKWAAVDPVIRAEITKREADVAKFVAEAQPSFNIAKSLHQTLQPYFPLFQKYNLDPMQHISALLSAHTTLLFGDAQQKATMFRNMAQQSGIDIAKLADPNSAAQANTQQLAYIRAMEERVARMEQGVSGVTSNFQKAQTAELEQGIMAFAGDTENHPFFWELAESGEIKALIDSGAARTLTDAYELALYRNPTTRAKQLELEGRKASVAAAKLATEKVTAARRATRANVTSRGAGRVPAAEESIDETIASTLSDIRSRH